MNKDLQTKFTIITGPEGLSEISFDADLAIFGNSTAADIQLDNPFVSRRHFQIRRETDVFWITDLGSRNGTNLNGIDLTPNKEYPLKHNDTVSLAQKNVILQFNEPVFTSNVTKLIDTPLITPTSHSQSDIKLRVDSDSRKAYVLGAEVPNLSRKQFDILEYLFSNKGKAVSRDQIANVGWPERPDDVSDSEIDQYIRQLRVRVESDPSKPQVIITRRGYGYIIP
tara:strand:- start:1503 stop:2177 length:675 start_codon:yes stop_codon:yes gene_type:complete